MWEERMRKLVFMFLIGALLLSVEVAGAQDFKQYVGKSMCEPGIQSTYSEFSLRLDKAQPLELITRRWDKAQVVFIVAPKADSKCGVIKDTVQVARENNSADRKHFEFRCYDAQAPTDVILGTARRKYGDISLVTAFEAWRIDLKENKFVKINHKVVCSADGWDGDDTGSDMIDAAKSYASHGKPGQFDEE
jgi:hypothetical protein